MTSPTDSSCATCLVPVRTRFASPDLTEQIVYGGLGPAADPALLITARTPDGRGVHFHNPSGTTAATRGADLPLATFERFFAGRGVSFRRMEAGPGA